MNGRAAITGYPVNLVVAGRRCVVVGAGRIAARKIAALVDAGADVHVIAPDATAEVRGWADAGRLKLADRKFEPADLDGAWLATTATGDPDVDHAVFVAAQDRHLWLNSADDPENCSFTLMSVVRSGDLVVTVGTGGRSPAFASWLKARLAGEFGPEYATLLDILSEAREELRASGRSSEDADWRQALDSGMLESIRAGRVDEAKETLRRMSLVVVGLNHRTVPVELLERLAVAPAALPKALQSLGRCEHLAEVVLLSTCNRTEVYANATLFHPAMQDVRDFLSDVSGVDPAEFSDLLYAYHDDAAVAHLFGVAAGLDSMIIGEGEILGQVREAWQAAEREEASGPLLSRTFRHAIEVGKRARTETAIGRHAVSVSSAAVSLANSRLGTLDDRRVLVLGAGEMGEGMALALAGAGVLEIVVANRTVSRGEELARRVGGRSISLDEVPAALIECDVLLVSTGATDLLMERSQVEHVMELRGGRALLVVDVGVPRNIDPGAGEVFGVDLLDIDDLRALGDQSLAQRRQEIGKVRDLIAAELDRHRLDRSAREVAPLVTALRARAEELRTLELERYRSKLAALDPAAREVIEAITQGVVNKLLHEPTIRVKDAAGTARGELYADALAELFDLPEPPADHTD